MKALQVKKVGEEHIMKSGKGRGKGVKEVLECNHMVRAPGESVNLKIRLFEAGFVKIYTTEFSPQLHPLLLPVLSHGSIHLSIVGQ